VLQQIVLIAADCIDRNGMERVEVVTIRGKEQLLVIKCCLCHIEFCNYKCVNISLFHSSTAFYIFIYSVS